MAKKIGFPNRPCPKCGKPIHIKSRSHDCGWKAEESVKAPAGETPSAIIRRVVKEKTGKATAAGAFGGITMADIQAVKDVVNKLGADTALRSLELTTETEVTSARATAALPSSAHTASPLTRINRTATCLSRHAKPVAGTVLTTFITPPLVVVSGRRPSPPWH